MHTVGGNRGATVDDTVEHVENVAAGDFVQHAATPARQNMLAKQALGSLYCSWAVRAPDVAFEKLFDDALDAVSLGGAGRDLLATGITPFSNRAQCLGA